MGRKKVLQIEISFKNQKVGGRGGAESAPPPMRNRVKLLGLIFFSKLDWGSYIIKTAFKKIGALICSMKFLFPEVILYQHTSTVRPYKESCCHVCAGSPSCYLVLLDKSQKWYYNNVYKNVIRMSMSTVSFLEQLDTGILCLQNAFLWSLI